VLAALATFTAAAGFILLASWDQLPAQPQT
jgi:hypothetical protein